MQVRLEGTGPARGLPVPGCPCAGCAGTGTGALPARAPARLRLPGGWLVDVEGETESPGGSGSLGSASLSGGPPLEGSPALEGVAGPEFTRVGPGALLVALPGDRSLLWAPQAGELPAATVQELAGANLAAVFIGPAPELDLDPSPDAIPALTGAARSLARLRAVAAITPGTACLLLGLGHRQGSAQRLLTCLAHWGARAPADGELVDLDDPPATGLPAGGRTLVLGGSASGKSGLAEDLLAAAPEVLYVATGPVVDLRSTGDSEWAQRVARHRDRRPVWWRTEETHQAAALLASAEQPVLLDSIGAWLTGVLDRAGAWRDKDGWHAELAGQTDALVQAWRSRRAPLVAVSDEVGWGVVPATSSGRLFTEELGRLNRRLAQESEQVLVVAAGQILHA